MWIQSLIIGIIGAVSIDLSTEIWDGMLQAMYKSIFDSISQFLSDVSAMGVQIFDFDWVNAVVEFFTMFGWTLFAVGYQTLFAYIIALIAYNFIGIFNGDIVGAWWVGFAFSVLALAFIILAVIRPDKKVK